MKARKVKKLDPATRFDRNAARIIRTRLAELRSHVPEALDPDAIEAQHDMRIAAKRVRYVLEVTGFCFGKQSQSARRSARELSDLLGEIHDCDVMLPRVQGEIERLRAEDARAALLQAAEATDLAPELVADVPNLDAYRGLELLAVHLQARRALLFERFSRFWVTEDAKGTWSKLERAVARRIAERGKEPESPPDPSPEAAEAKPAPEPSRSVS